MGPYPRRPIHRRPLPRHPHGYSDHSESSDCDNVASSPLERRFFDDRSNVDRVSGLPKIYFGGGGRGFPGFGGDDEEDAYGGVDDYSQDRGAYGGYGDDYGYGGGYGDDNDGYGNDDYGYGGRGRGNDYGVDDYRQGRPSYGGGPSRGRGPSRGNHPTLNADHKYSEHDYAANANQHSLDIADRRQGRLSLDERHADEQSYDKTGRDRVMVDRYGQRVTSSQEKIDAARRQADASDLHYSGPRGSIDQSKRSASEDTFNSDNSERTFVGPNRHSTERNTSVSTSSRNVNSESTRIVSRPTRRH